MTGDKPLVSFDYAIKYLLNDRDEIEYALVKGVAKGIEESMAEIAYKKSIEVAKNLLSPGIDIDTIFYATGLSIQEIETLK